MGTRDRRRLATPLHPRRTTQQCVRLSAWGMKPLTPPTQSQNAPDSSHQDQVPQGGRHRRERGHPQPGVGPAGCRGGRRARWDGRRVCVDDAAGVCVCVCVLCLCACSSTPSSADSTCSPEFSPRRANPGRSGDLAASIPTVFPDIFLPFLSPVPRVLSSCTLGYARVIPPSRSPPPPLAENHAYAPPR